MIAVGNLKNLNVGATVDRRYIGYNIQPDEVEEVVEYLVNAIRTEMLMKYHATVEILD